jgi:hypothetical protein
VADSPNPVYLDSMQDGAKVAPGRWAAHAVATSLCLEIRGRDSGVNP